MGPEMMQQFRAQAERFGTRFITDDVTEFKLTDGGVHEVIVGKDTYRAKAVDPLDGRRAQAPRHPRRDGAPGPRRLHLRRLRRRLLQGRGRRRHRRRRLRDGGLDLHLQVRRASSRASTAATSSARRRSWSSAPATRTTSSSSPPTSPRSSSPAMTARSATSALKHAETGETKDLAVGGAFVAIGHRPRSELVKGQVEINEDGYVITDEPSTRTNLAGVFAVGDLVDHTYRQAVTAAGSGTKGALDAEWYLRDMGRPRPRSTGARTPARSSKRSKQPAPRPASSTTSSSAPSPWPSSRGDRPARSRC